MEKINQKRINELKKIAIQAANTTHDYTNFDLENNNTIQYINELENYNNFQQITDEIINKPNINNQDKMPGIYNYFWDEKTQPYSSNLKKKPENGIFYSKTEYQILCCQYRLLLIELIAKQILYNVKTKQTLIEITDYYELTTENINLLKSKKFDFERIKNHYESEINAFVKSPIKNEEKKYSKYQITLIILLSITIIFIPITIFIYFKISQKNKLIIERNSFDKKNIKKTYKLPYDLLLKNTCEEILKSTNDQGINNIVNKVLTFFPQNVDKINTNNLTDERKETITSSDRSYIRDILDKTGLDEDLTRNLSALLDTLPITINTKLITISLKINSTNPQAVESAIKQKSFGLDVNYNVDNSTIENNVVIITISAYRFTINVLNNKNFIALFNEESTENKIIDAFIDEFSPIIIAKNASSKLTDINTQGIFNEIS